MRGRRLDCVKIFLTCSLIAMQNLVVVSYTASAHVGPKKLVDAVGLRPLQTGVWLTLQKHATPECYHSKFRRSRSNKPRA